MLCLRPRRGDAVYPEFDPAVHVLHPGDPRLDQGIRGEVVWHAGMDFGIRSESVVLLERCLHALSFWVTKPSHTGHHPPEHFAVLAILPLVAVAFAVAVRDARARSEWR